MTLLPFFPPRRSPHGLWPTFLPFHFANFYAISCILEFSLIQDRRMMQDIFPTKWKFVVEFEDEQTREVSGTIGQANTREECEGLLECEMDEHNRRGQCVLNAEAVEICANCQGEGKVADQNGGMDRCEVCGGRLGPVANLTMLSLNRREFLLIRRGDFSGPLSPRRAA
jgi:hypothetical protein